ncbi:hypothetical protein DQK91_18805 [Oceanidesulfovibrio marinus]|uniref:Uncharacterized protein n=2 Tax=Oceanidesulfovibrio marinus TaxID=370038 RepID=A0A6P1ZCE3_9BACT|nr:hypothetical protein DQK91_18805 [Oceanidesulfovibrio marinus]
MLGASGLSTRVDPVRLQVNKDTGLIPLAAAVNVELDDTGRVSRRKGFQLHLSLAGAHSLFYSGGHCLFAAGTGLYRLHEDGTVSLVHDGLSPGFRVRYAQVERDIFFVNGKEGGRYSEFDGQVRTGLPAATRPYPGDFRHREALPAGHLIAYYCGRLFVADEEALWWTEPHDYIRAVLAENYAPMTTRPRMIAPVNDGIYVSTSRETWFLAGATPEAFQFIKVANYPAIEGTETRVEGRIGGGETRLDVALWATSKGICMGGPGGNVLNLTEQQLDLPDAMRGVGCIINDQYVALIEPGG